MSFSVPPNWLPVFDGMGTLVPTPETPLLAPVCGVCGSAGHGAGRDLVVGDVHGDVEDRLARCCGAARASAA